MQCPIMDKIFITLLCLHLAAAKIKINKLDVPSSILYGSQNDVILDCDFDSGGDDVTEIKWFLDGDTQIYQWLPSTNRKAQAIGKLKNHIDVDYRATDDAKTMYRALHITDLSPDFSGNYTCKVSSLTSEDVETKRMIIYVIPEEALEFDNDVIDITVYEDDKEIICTAGSFFPRPNMTLYVLDEHDNNTETAARQDLENATLTEEGYFNVTSVLSYEGYNFSKVFHTICEVTIPGTPFNISETWIHSQVDNSEIEVEEELINAANWTEILLEEAPEIETQIEDESDFNASTTESANMTENFSEEETTVLENSSLRHLPTTSLLLITFAMASMWSLYL